MQIRWKCPSLKDMRTMKSTRLLVKSSGTPRRTGRMKLAVKRDVLEVRANASAGAPFRYSGDADEDESSSSSSSVCCIGIEHLLTPACALGVKTCRARCKQAVFSEQARQSPSARYSWEGTALASIAQTRKPALRARILGKLHRDSI